MSASVDFAKLSVEELLAEEKRLKKHEFYAAFGFGFLAGVMGFGLITGGFGMVYVAIPVGFMIGIYRNAQLRGRRMEAVRAELDARYRGQFPPVAPSQAGAPV